MKHLSFAIRSLLLAAVSFSTAMADDDALALFEQRIMPIFRSPKPSSCVQCHLSAVDLKDYIMPSHEQTFVALRDQGLVDIASPEESKILKLIGMGEKDADAGARLIHEKTRQAEYDAFAAWIKACCGDQRLLALPAPADADPAGPSRPEPVIRHNRKDRVLDSFVRNVWSQRMRCFPCHTPHELDVHNPQHRVPMQRHQEFEELYGQRINIFRESPEETMKALIAASRKHSSQRLPLLNLEEPEKSLLVLKPTSKLPSKGSDGKFERPSSVEPVSHMGGLKMHVDDQSYKSFVAWISDYARVANDEYASENSLPPDNWYPTKHVLRITDVPSSWPDSATAQLFVYPWDAHNKQWQAEPIAFTQATVTPRKIVNGVLFMFLRPGAEQPSNESGHASLRPGKYQIKAYVDSKKRLVKDPTALLGQDDFVGQTVIQARWKEGFPQAEIVSGSQMTSESEF